MMLLKALVYNIDGQAQNYINDQKQAPHLRIPPRALFRVQMISTLVCSFVSLGTIALLFDTIKDYCSEDQPDKFTCPSARTYFSASVLWGVIGPERSLVACTQYCPGVS